MLYPRGEVPGLCRGGQRPVPGRLLEPRLRREAHRLSDRPHLLVAGILYAALAQVRDVGAGHHASGGLVELLSRPADPVRAAVSLEEKLEPLRYVQSSTPGVA